MTPKYFFRNSLFLIPLLILSGCIHNDVPFPRIEQFITAIAAVGESSPAVIDDQNFSVTINLDETTDPSKVRFSQYEYTEGASSSLDLLTGEYDLTSSLKVTLSKYQDYQWVITAKQNIERYFNVAGQVGSTVIDEVGRRIIVRVPLETNLSKLTLTDIKLGPAGITTICPELAPGVIDLSKPLAVDVTFFGKTQKWTIYAERSAQIVTTTAVDAWAQVIWAYAEAPEDAEKGFQYRRADSSEWIDVPQEWITVDGGSFYARIPHLTPLTSYVVRALADDNVSSEVTVTTESTMILPDGSFDQWWLNGKIWCPWDQNGLQYWDTGNTGATTLGNSNVTPSDYTSTGSGKAAKLETKFVGIAGIGKLATGSIFTGKFARVDGTNGILDFGQPFTLHPTRFRGYYQYKSSPINYASKAFEHLRNQPDSCHVYVILTDWDAPFEIRTNPNNQHLLDFDAPYIIAYGGVSTSATTDHYVEFDVPLQYRSTSRKPKYILVCASASKYGDYFTGGSESVLYVDQLSLEYDY